jgi:hypothetical protein
MVSRARPTSSDIVTGTSRIAPTSTSPDAAAPRASGGGHEQEGEDIAVLELPLDEAYAMAMDGRIDDAKTILLIQAAALKRHER